MEAVEPQDLQTDYSEDGVDLTLIRAMLAMTPAERLAFHEQRVQAIFEILEHTGTKPEWLFRAPEDRA